MMIMVMVVLVVVVVMMVMMMTGRCHVLLLLLLLLLSVLLGVRTQTADLAAGSRVCPGTRRHPVRRWSVVLVADAGLGLQAGQPQIFLDLRHEQVDVACEERVRLCRTVRHHTDQIRRLLGTRHPRAFSLVIVSRSEETLMLRPLTSTDY